MDEDSIGFSAKAPVSAWNKRIGVDTPGLFRAALTGALAYFTGNAPGAIGSAIGATAAFKLRPQPPAGLAWLLIRRALAHAMAELTVEAVQKHGAELRDKEGLVGTLDEALDATEIRIDPAFFERPADSSIVGAVQEPFAEWLSSLGLNHAEAASVLPRLGAYFTFALRQEWAREAEAYAPIDSEIAKHENRFAGAVARERAWLRNAAYLERQIHEPVFEESFGLAQVYVPLRAWYRDTHTDSRRSASDARTDGKERSVVVDLEEHLDAWFESADPRDAIRAICGGPGSGKTSVAKMWAARLAKANRKALFVPLHRLVLRQEHPDVQALLEQFLSDRNVLPENPLGRDGEPRLLIVFDGLDELAMQGHAGRDLARNFVDEVGTRVGNWNDRDGRLVQVLLGGRDIAVEATRLADLQILHILPYHGERPEGCEDPHHLLANPAYGCDVWWQKLGQAIGESYEGLPPALAGEQLAEITAHPLLNYLLALRYRKGGLDARIAGNLNLLYRDLLDDVYDRRWGPGAHPTANVLQRRDFHALLDELGLVAWHGGMGRTVSERAVEDACDRVGLGEPLAQLKDAARRPGAISLLTAFYFHQADRLTDGERPFEFTHKSFGEYLAARRLMRVVREIDDDRAGKEKRDAWLKEAALVPWCRMTGPAAMDEDLLAFLLREAELESQEPNGPAVVKRWQQSFADLLNYQLQNGLPMKALDLPSFHEMTRHARNAEEALLAAHFCCASAVGESSSIRWPSPVALRNLVMRLEQGDSQALARRCLGWLGTVRTHSAHDLAYANLAGASFQSGNFERANLAGVDLTNANLAGANLTGAILTGASRKELADLSGANLERANLTGATLTKAVLGGANLTKAKLERTMLVETDLREANLTEANLVGATLEGAMLGNANLTKAILKQVILEGLVLKWATLRQADLRGAVLGKANLEEANLDVADLMGAILEETMLGGASLAKAKLNQANLKRAILGDAYLTGANLTKAILTGANLIRTHLDRAILVGADLSGANLIEADLRVADLSEANLVGVQGLDEARGLGDVRSWLGARIERKWVERLNLDAEKLGLIVVDDLDAD